MLKVGQNAPTFRLESAAGPVSLKDFRGKYVVLYFYPRDSTPGCTTEAIGFRDAARELARREAVVVGVSRDSTSSHDKFACKYELPFALLSDPDAEVIKAYGAWGKKTLYGRTSEGILRQTVIIGQSGKIEKRFEKVKPAGHADEVIAAIDELRGAA